MSYFNNKKTFVWAIVVLTLLNIFSLSALFIQHHRISSCIMMDSPPDGRHPRFDKMEHFMKREIGFSKIQIDSFRYSKKMHIEKMQDLNSELHKMKKQLMDGAFDESFTTENANKLIREIGNVQIEIEQAGHNHLLEMKRICGDGQQEKLENLLKEAMIRHKPKFHKHKRPPAYDKFHNRKRQPPDGSKQPSD